MNLRAFLVAAILAFASAQAEVNVVNHDQVQPFAQPEPKTDSEKAAVKFKPQLVVSYGCYPYPAVQADGSVSGGLKGTGPADGECKGSSLGSQVYSRSTWHGDTWGIIYTWYLPKGKKRHLWETAVIWTDDPALQNSTVLASTVNYGWSTAYHDPVEAKYLDDSSVKLDSSRSYTSSKPRLQLTKEVGEFQDLITWEQLTEEARNALSTVDWEMPLKDGTFEERLRDAWPL